MSNFPTVHFRAMHKLIEYVFTFNATRMQYIHQFPQTFYSFKYIFIYISMYIYNIYLWPIYGWNIWWVWIPPKTAQILGWYPKTSYVICVWIVWYIIDIVPIEGKRNKCDVFRSNRCTENKIWRWLCVYIWGDATYIVGGLCGLYQIYECTTKHICGDWWDHILMHMCWYMCCCIMMGVVWMIFLTQEHAQHIHTMHHRNMFCM